LQRALPDRTKSDYDFVMAVRLGLCALVVLVTLNDSACDAFLRDHGKQIFRGFAALFLSGTFSYLMYRLATCFVRDSASRRRNRDRLRAEIQKSGLLLLAGCLKMVVILEPRLEHHIAWLSWLSLAFAVLGFLVRWRGPKRRLTLRDRRSAVAAND
jgi:hypothetical protein